jgi:translation initiation factor 4A
MNELFIEPTANNINLEPILKPQNCQTSPNEIVESDMSEFTTEKWDDFNLKTNLLRGIYNIGFENPSPIQKKAIKPLILGRDVIGQAQSGSGKTGTFTIGILERIDVADKSTQAIIMAPTHELATQITSVIRMIGNMMEGLVVQTLVGGSNIQDDASLLKNNTPHIVVGCPGRIFDTIKRQFLDTRQIRLFVLDEADEMLSSGFKEQIYNIFQFLPSTIQVAIFSATMPNEILQLTNKFMRDPVKILMKAEDLSLKCIEQYYIALANDHSKYETLKHLFEFLSVSQCIIYTNSVKRVIDLHTAMTNEGFSVCCIHSSMDKKEREATFASFKSGGSRVLISSNITSRGIDVQQVSTVINFDIPHCVHNYLHRVGRSGRWGRKGLAINFVTRHDINYMRDIENHYKSPIAELPADFSSLRT